jgi:hypothetical protein
MLQTSNTRCYTLSRSSNTRSYIILRASNTQSYIILRISNTRSYTCHGRVTYEVTDELPTITRELPNKYTGIIISIHRLGKLYT